MITFLETNIDIVHRSSPQWVYDYLFPVILIILALLALVLVFGLCILAYKDFYD